MTLHMKRVTPAYSKVLLAVKKKGQYTMMNWEASKLCLKKIVPIHALESKSVRV